MSDTPSVTEPTDYDVALAELLDAGMSRDDALAMLIDTTPRSAVAEFDYLHPDYAPIWKARARKLAALHDDPELHAACMKHYREHPEGVADFIADWGVTVDPRNGGTDRPIVMPFVLFPKQREFLITLRRHWINQDDLVLVKSRDCGASWLAMAFSVWLCLFYRDVTVGFGSATEEKVDKSGEPDCLFYKGRKFVEYLPTLFKGDWDVTKPRYSMHRTLVFPDTDSTINGQVGDNIGRGGRKSIYFVDEFAVVERPKLVDSNLIANTNCRIEMSTVQGTANVFAERARGGLIKRFDFHYRDDPRKVNAGADRVEVFTDPDDGITRNYTIRTGDMYPWFARKQRKTDSVVWNQEYECDFNASVEGILIPQLWVQSAIGALRKLGLAPTGRARGSFDVADRGIDKNAYVSALGVEVRRCDVWSGKGSDIYESVERAFRTADECGDDGFDYDGDGMGAGVRGDARKVNEARAELTAATPYKPVKQLDVQMFRGSGEVLDPDDLAPGTDTINKNMFENYKAQSWWALMRRFLLTWQAVTAHEAGVPIPFNPSDIISLDPSLPNLTLLCSELSQPTRKFSKSGKLMIDKDPDDVASPNAADAVMIRFAYRLGPMVIDPSVFRELSIRSPHVGRGY